MNRFKENRRMIILTTLISVLPVIAGLFLYDRLPEMMPVHFNFAGEADQYYPKLKAILIPGAFMPLIQMLCIFATLSDPKNRNISGRIFSLVLWIVPVISIYTGVMMYLKAMDHDIDVTAMVILLLGMVFVIMGNYLPKCRQNYTIGIRCPWTLNDTENWDMTHRFGGYVFVICGLLVMATVFLDRNISMAVLLVLISAAGILTYGYSYLLYRKKNRD